MVDAEQDPSGGGTSGQNPRRRSRDYEAGDNPGPERRRRRLDGTPQALPQGQVTWIEAVTGGLATVPADDPMEVDSPAAEEESLDQALDTWAAEEGQGEGEDRAEAARRIRAWVAVDNAGASLRLSGLNLACLPPRLPARLQILEAGGNRLTSLAGAPAGLLRLYASNNWLTSLEEAPAGLLDLDVSENELTSLQGAPAGLQSLYASSNRLTKLEDAPGGLRWLVVSSNRLTSLEGAPPGLEELEANFNRLTSLRGAPAGLQALEAVNNRLTGLEGAPEGLKDLDVSDNELTSLEGAPSGLQILNASDNLLTRLPEDLLRHLGTNCMIDLEGNPLSDRVLTNLAAAMNAPDYAGPRVLFSMDEGAEKPAARPLDEAVADWLGDDAAEAAAWQGFAAEEGAPEYARFLDRLRGTASYGNPDFQEAVIKGLRQAAARPQLRQKYFLQAFGASETCEDRVTLTWNGMQTARLADDVETGAYDQRLDKLVLQARRMFRLDALDRIAREKVRSLNFVDEIEVYLAYQVKLRELLDLELVAPDMRFFDVSYVTEADLAAAAARVRDEEAADFADYLSTRWQPWETVVSRIDPEAHAAVQDKLVEAMEEEFQDRLAKRLAAETLTAFPDAERQLGAQVKAELEREIKGELTRQVLQDKGLESLLDPPAA